jgi:hypothetical protein
MTAINTIHNNQKMKHLHTYLPAYASAQKGDKVRGYS